MTIQIAGAIVQRLGPCRVVLDQQAHAELACELALSGCELASSTGPTPPPSRGASAGFLQWAGPGAGRALEDALRPFSGLDALVLRSNGQDRTALETALFAAGWRRHPAGMMLHEYESWTADMMPALSFWQRARGTSPGWLNEGCSADPHLARFAMAAQHVRPGDRVLIDSAASPDAVAIVAALSRAGSAEIITDNLSAVGNHQVDLMIAFDPVCPQGWTARLDDYARVLKFDGRIVLGWRRDFGDDSRPTSWEALDTEMSERFVPELRYAQIAVSPNPRGPHAMLRLPAEQPAAVDWLIMVASANPLDGGDCAEEYDNPAYPRVKGPLPVLVDFGSAYDNPWLYRALVQMGERLNHDVKLARLAECVIGDSRVESADRGAAIAVLGYRVLEMRRVDLSAVLLPAIKDYVGQPLTDETPVHVRRWRISLAFLAGRLCELSEDRATAKTWYREAAEADWNDFSPLLATKSIAASFYEARIHLSEGDPQTALACFRHGMNTALEAAAFPHGEQMAADGQPLPFYLQELAEVIDMGSQCANAIAHFSLWHRDPGLFWRQVDVRRFGLASWARDLERENERLRAA